MTTPSDRKPRTIYQSEAARQLGVSRQWVQQLVAAGRLAEAGWGPGGRLLWRREVERINRERRERQSSAEPTPTP